MEKDSQGKRELSEQFLNNLSLQKTPCKYWESQAHTFW